MKSNKMAQKFLTKLIFKISMKHLIFFLIVSIGFFYQVFQITKGRCQRSIEALPTMITPHMRFIVGRVSSGTTTLSIRPR